MEPSPPAIGTGLVLRVTPGRVGGRHHTTRPGRQRRPNDHKYGILGAWSTITAGQGPIVTLRCRSGPRRTGTPLHKAGHFRRTRIGAHRGASRSNLSRNRSCARLSLRAPFNAEWPV